MSGSGNRDERQDLGESGESWDWPEPSAEELAEREAVGHEIHVPPLLNELENATSADAFHQAMGLILRLWEHLQQSEREWVIEKVSKPWSRRSGAPAKHDRDWAIWMRYALMPDAENRPRPRRVHAIAEIVRDHGLTAEAAAKAYDTAFRRYRDLPPASWKEFLGEEN
jgi:hypothetical protein